MPSPASTPSSPLPASSRRRLGRFELQRVLGQGAQATVWLAHDARLDRDVAVKLLLRDAAGTTLDEWLHEARAVSRLTHPNIVPVFEAGEEQGQAFLVFEYVAGPTLAALLKQRGHLPAREAAGLMLGVLDALKAAHAAGIVHRDLKPSNILIDEQGRARVMDFGIAARTADTHDNRICGTPGYISPEAARGSPPSPGMDIFAAGMLLGHLLAGAPLMREREPMRALQRVQVEDMVLPQELPHPVDDTLRGVVMRAIARDPALRHPDAASFHRALSQWLNPPAPAEMASASGTLEFLLRRMKHKSDFPALSDSVGRIQRVANSENVSIASLAGEILKDVALTNKLLRMVNTAHYSAAGGAVSTVSRAVALVGFAGIRNMALSLVLLEHMQDKSHAQRLKEEFLRSLMAGTLADELSSGSRDGEEAFLSAMFQGLGRLLTEFYFPEEALQIRELMRPATGEEAVTERVASARVLGLSFEDLGTGVARSWDLPDTLQKAMRVPVGAVPAKPVERGSERLRWLGRVASEVADALLEGGDSALRVREIGERYEQALGVEPRVFTQAAEQAQQRLSQLAQAMNLEVGATSAARRLMAPPPVVPDDTLTPHHLTDSFAPTAEATMVSPHAPADLLAAGIQDVTQHMVSDGFRLNEVLRMILETMYRALGLRRVVFCLRDPKTEMLTGRFGLGDGAERVAAAFKVPLRPVSGAPPDLFTAICLKGADTLIADTTSGNIAARLPAWFAREVQAPTFLMLPLVIKQAPFGLIYADKAQPGGIVLEEKELNLLRTLRNQAVMAFRQGG